MFLAEGVKYLPQCDVWVLAIKHNMSNVEIRGS